MKSGTICRTLIIAALAALIIIPAAGCIKLPRKAASTSGQLKVPINAVNAGNLGSLEFELVYDPAIVQAEGVTKGDLADNAMLDFSLSRTGRIWVALVDSNGLNGNGSLAVISFHRVGSGQTAATLKLENVIAHDAINLVDIITSTTAGSLTTPPVINFTR
ncbi:MAG: cohesin domain-containing protein [Dehalococcoidia bacterium]